MRRTKDEQIASVKQAIAILVEQGQKPSQVQVCRMAGVSTNFFYYNPDLKALVKNACWAVSRKSTAITTGRLNNQILEGLYCGPTPGTKPEDSRSPQSWAMKAVAKHLGLNPAKGNDDWWNTCIDHLDENYPGWRGYSCATEHQEAA